jgi:hypothetical protein
LDGEHSGLLTHALALATIVGKQNEEAFGGNTMDTQWKQVKRITLSSIKTLEEDLRDSETTLSQTMGTNFESVMLKAGYDENLAREWVPMSHLYRISLLTNLESVILKAGYGENIAREWVPMSHLYRISLLGFQYYVGLPTHLWKVVTTNS